MDSSELETQVEAAREAGDPAALLEVARSAFDRVMEAVDAAPESERRDMLMAAKRIGYNAASDIWPGWELGVVRSAAELQAGRGLAERSGAIVERLGLDGMEKGNAVWLIGAYDLAQGRYADALETFRAATDLFAGTPAMHLLGKGYVAIAEELTGKPPALATTIAALDELATDDAAFMRDQLLVAREVFAGHAGAV